MSNDRYCFLGGWWSSNLKVTQAFFQNDLLDRGDELIQHKDKSVSMSNPLVIIRSTPRHDGFVYIYSINIFPYDASIDDLHVGTVWTLIKEGDASSDPI